MSEVSLADAAEAMASIWSPIDGGVTAPNGFEAAGVVVGLKPSGRPDLALILAPDEAVCAGTFTTSVVRAACVDLCRGAALQSRRSDASRVDQLRPGERLHW
jgi:glutamate N-acetyltransferase/amino-acid N-acetyltransferase